MNTTAYIEDCQPLLFNISSYGLWENLKSPDVIFGYSLPLMEIQILLIFVSIIMSHMCFRYIGISQDVSYMIAGLIMGPQLFDLRNKSSRKLSWDPALDGNAALKGFAVCAIMMSTFLMSVKTNRRVLFNTGRLPIVIGLLTFIIPLLIARLGFRNLLTDTINPNYMPQKKALVERSLIIATQSSILLPTVTYVLSELKILNSEFGRLALSATIVNDLLGSFLLVPVYVVATYKADSYTTTYIDIIAVIFFFLVLFFVFRPIVEWIAENTPKGKPVADKYVHAVLLTLLASTVYSIFFNMKFMGPFLVGLVIPEGPPFGSTLEAKYEKLTMKVLLPISIAFITTRCDIMMIIYKLDDIFFNIFLVTLIFFLKLVASLVPCLYCKLPLKESFAVSILLSCRGFTDIFLFQLLLDDSYISQATYSFIIMFVLLNSGIVPIVLSSLYDPKRKYIGYQERNILSLKPNSDLRILTCVHNPNNVSGFIAFLQLLSSSNHDLPIVVTVLHLVKLVGQLIPVLISHNKKSKQLINNSYTNTAIITFSMFNQGSFKSTIVNMFTALSHENIMHEDICMLAQEQTTSMIIVPSGRTWTIDGVFQSDDESIRRVNMSLLDSAPCTVGILVDRGQFLHRSKTRDNINVGVIFIGGKNDREALSLGNRMKDNPMVHVTVIRLISNKETESTNSDHILDHDIIKELKYQEATNNISYIEISVSGGPEVAATVRLLAEEYHLMIVGREHGMASPDFSGLTEWVELPELGVIGDLLAVRDLGSRVSVLVVQQHHL